eukprot:4508656-Pyramimonas_sp.AAC.1
MLEVLWTKAAAGGAAAGSEPPKEARGAGPPPDDASTKTVVNKLIPIDVSLDRRVATLEDRASFVCVCVVKKDDAKKELGQLRTLCKTEDKERRSAFDKAKESDMHDAKLTPRSLGGGLRSVLFKAMLEQLD